ncbi:MAG: DUF3822 family protein, partial [Bacteroidales bacterium]|nr:DUF3822 family protein [Bacteroidales bacterium]
PQLEKTNEYRLSIQADLNGFSFLISDDLHQQLYYLYQSDFNWERVHYDIFFRHTGNLLSSLPLLSKHYSKVTLLYDTFKYALIPKHLYKAGEELGQLGKLHKLDDLEEIDVVEIPGKDIVVLFAVNSTFINLLKTKQPSFSIFPSIYTPLLSLPTLYDYNKVYFNYSKGQLHLIIYEGVSLIYCNSFPATYFNTALYFLFLALKQTQFNPEQTTVFVSGNIPDTDILQLSKYFSKIKYFRNPAVPLGSAENEMRYSSLTFDL